MKCTNHPETDAAGACVYCGKLFCAACLVEIKGKNYCKADVEKVLADSNEQTSRESANQKVVLVQTAAPESRSKLKTAVLVLSIVFGIIGILWAFIGPVIFAAVGVAQAMSTSTPSSDSTSGTWLATSAARILLSLIFIVAAMVMGLVSSSSKTGKTATIVLGSIVMVMGIFSSWLLQYVSGPAFVLCGFLALMDGTKQSKVQASQ